MTKEQLKQIIAGNSSDTLDAELIAWINSGNMDSELEKMIDSDLQQSFGSPALADKSLNALVDNILKAHKKQSKINNQAARSRHITSISIPMMLRVAAVISFFAVISYVLVFYIGKHEVPKDTAQLVTKENSKGRKSTLFLNDGTVINLNSESRITYPEVFGDSIREITLEGEAFFDVARNENVPFVIRTGDISLTVVGTSFNVSAFSEQESIRISMNSGVVAISSKSNSSKSQEPVSLIAGESISYSKVSGTFSAISTFNSKLEYGWKDGIMAFHNASMHDIFSSCERWYNVQFDLKNKPNFQWNYTGEFQNQTLQDVLESLSFSQNFTFKIEKNTISVSFN